MQELVDNRVVAFWFAKLGFVVRKGGSSRCKDLAEIRKGRKGDVVIGKGLFQKAALK